MLKKLTITVGGLIGLLVLLAGIKVLQFQTMFAAGAAMIPPPEPVTTAVVTQEAWAPTIDAIGSLTAVQGVTVAAELDGKIVHLAFDPGSVVKAGEVRFEFLQQDSVSEARRFGSGRSGDEGGRLLRHIGGAGDLHDIVQTLLDPGVQRRLLFDGGREHLRNSAGLEAFLPASIREQAHGDQQQSRQEHEKQDDP